MEANFKRQNLGLVWGQFGVHLGSIWDQFGANLGPIWGQFGANLGAIWGQFGINLGPNWDQFGANLGPSWDYSLGQFGVQEGGTPHSYPQLRGAYVNLAKGKTLANFSGARLRLFFGVRGFLAREFV